MIHPIEKVRHRHGTIVLIHAQPSATVDADSGHVEHRSHNAPGVRHLGLRLELCHKEGLETVDRGERLAAHVPSELAKHNPVAVEIDQREAMGLDALERSFLAELWTPDQVVSYPDYVIQ